MNREELIADIYEISHALKKGMYTRMQQAMTSTAVSPSQLHLLFMIKQLQPVNAKELAVKLQLTAGAISQLVENLSSQGLIVRVPHPSDRRVHTLELSPQGEQALSAIEDQRRQAMDTVMQTLTDIELQTWHTVQQKLLHAFKHPANATNATNERSNHV